MEYRPRIILGVCGGIAAYKSVYLLRLLVKKGYDVQVVATPDALEFVGPVTWSALSGKPTLSAFFESKTGLWNSHVDLAKSADAIVVAPLTAQTLAKWALGLCDNLLLAILQSSTAPIFAAPAMDLDMYQFHANKENLERLKRMGVHIIPAESGELASGLSGEGRMADPEIISDRIESWEDDLPKLEGIKIVITLGPTREYLDAVRYLSNPSSGRMGIALAHAFKNCKASVHLIAGPLQVKIPHDCTCTRVVSADEMLSAATHLHNDFDIFVGAAAVSDFKFNQIYSDKLKKENFPQALNITLNADILHTMSKLKNNNQLICGFALETGSIIEKARQKLITKNLDLVVVNDVSEKDAAFDSPLNHVWIITADGREEEIALQSKNKVAAHIVKHIARLFYEKGKN